MMIACFIVPEQEKLLLNEEYKQQPEHNDGRKEERQPLSWKTFPD